MTQELDMFQKIDLKEMVAQWVLLDERIMEVLRIVAQYEISLNHMDPNKWTIRRVYISTLTHPGREAMTTVCLRVGDSNTYKLLEMLGDWEDAEETRNLERTISFPTRYIHTSGWEDELAENFKRQQIWWAERKVADLDRALTDSITREKELQSKLIQAMKDLRELRDEPL